jgi:cobyrinic acid a,c-diamide synthase
VTATPGLVVAAPRSSSGKTTVTLGLLRAFARRGLRVAGAKCGPDYIDPAFHAAATGRPSVNLDAWAMGPALLGGLASLAARDAELVLCEGLMGLFDGVPAVEGRSGSSADIAAATGWPVLLVLDVSGQSQSAAAVAKGCAGYDPRIRVAGVIANRVGSDRHRRLVREAIEGLGLPLLGALPRSDAIRMPERHLGLVQAEETSSLPVLLDAMADLVEQHVDLERVHGLAGPLTIRPDPAVPMPPPGQRIALARDVAFSFAYPHLVMAWRAAGAEVLPFSPLADEAPPKQADCCWLPGGYPELHAGPLAAAQAFKSGLRRFAATRPVHGECGGYMVLGRGLTDAAGVEHAMAGLLDLSTTFAVRRMTLGYREAELDGDCALGRAGKRLRGHEFHYATVTDRGADPPFARVRDAYGGDWVPAGSRQGLVSGSFFHLIAAHAR